MLVCSSTVIVYYLRCFNISEEALFIGTKEEVINIGSYER